MLGFYRKIVDKESLLFFMESGFPISKYFSADALVFTDSLSIEIYQMYSNGVSEIEIFKKLKDDINRTIEKTDGEIKATN